MFVNITDNIYFSNGNISVQAHVNQLNVLFHSITYMKVMEVQMGFNVACDVNLLEHKLHA